MKRILTSIAALAAVLGAAVPAFGQAASGATSSVDEWDLARIAARAVEADPAVRASGALAGIAAAQYGLELDKASPRFSLALTPGSFDSRRIFDFSSYLYNDVQTISGAAGLSYSQALPSAGTFSAGVKTSIGVADKGGETGYALSPSLTASLRQPVLAGGEFLPFGAAAAARRSVGLAAEQAAIDALGRRNQAVRSAVETAGRVIVLRRSLAVQESALASALGRAAALGLRRSSGTATEDAAIELELAAELVRQSLADTRLSLHDAERRLASVLGRDPAGGAPLLPALSERIPLFTPAAPVLTAPALAGAPDAARAAKAAEKARADAAVRGTNDAPSLGASFAASPRYPDTRTDAGDFGSILSDYSDTAGGAGFDINLSLTLDVPLSAGASRSYRARIDALSVEAADAQRFQAERSVLDRAASLAERRDYLSERLAIQRRIAALAARKADRLADLGAAGTASAVDVADAATDRGKAAAEVLRVELDLLLAELDLRALAGEDLAASLAAARN